MFLRNYITTDCDGKFFRFCFRSNFVSARHRDFSRIYYVESISQMEPRQTVYGKFFHFCFRSNSANAWNRDCVWTNCIEWNHGILRLENLFTSVSGQTLLLLDVDTTVKIIVHIVGFNGTISQCAWQIFLFWFMSKSASARHIKYCRTYFLNITTENSFTFASGQTLLLLYIKTRIYIKTLCIERFPWITPRHTWGGKFFHFYCKSNYFSVRHRDCSRTYGIEHISWLWTRLLR